MGLVHMSHNWPADSCNNNIKLCLALFPEFSRSALSCEWLWSLSVLVVAANHHSPLLYFASSVLHLFSALSLCLALNFSWALTARNSSHDIWWVVLRDKFDAFLMVDCCNSEDSKCYNSDAIPRWKRQNKHDDCAMKQTWWSCLSSTMWNVCRVLQWLSGVATVKLYNCLAAVSEVLTSQELCCMHWSVCHSICPFHTMDPIGS